jgi:hypothetical protein
MDMGWMHAALAAVVLVALGLFARACFGGSRMLGGFWDRERAQRSKAAAAAREQRAAAPDRSA